MGQKVNPKSFRLSVDRGWQSKWFSTKKYKAYLHQDLEIRGLVFSLFPPGTIASVEVERKLGEIEISIHTSRPGIVIGRSGQGTQELKEKISKKIKGKINISIIEVEKPEANASLVAQNIAYQIEKRVAFKKAAKAAMTKAQEAGALGIKVKVTGRLGGVEIARGEVYAWGSIPLQTLRADIDFAKVNANTTYGVIGIKVWIYKGEVFAKKPEIKSKKEQAFPEP